MPDFDDEEYESFELEGKNGRTRTVAGVAEVEVVEVEVDPEEDADDADDEDDDDDDPEDATEEEIDFVLAAYREDGQPYVQVLAKDLANDLDELIIQLRRLPGDAGAIGFVSLLEEIFVIARVRGQHVQVLLSDSTAAADWPIARDVADYLGEDVPEDDEEPEPMGDLGMLSDLGLSDFDLGAILDDLDMGSDEMLLAVADRINLNPQFRKVAEAALTG